MQITNLCVCVCVYTSVEARDGTECLPQLLHLIFEALPLTVLTIHTTGQPVPGTLLSPCPSTGLTDGESRIQTQVFMFAQDALHDQASPHPQNPSPLIKQNLCLQ